MGMVCIMLDDHRLSDGASLNLNRSHKLWRVFINDDPVRADEERKLTLRYAGGRIERPAGGCAIRVGDDEGFPGPDAPVIEVIDREHP